MYKPGDRVRVIGNENNEAYYSIGNVGEVLTTSYGRFTVDVLFDSDANGNRESWVVELINLEYE